MKRFILLYALLACFVSKVAFSQSNPATKPIQKQKDPSSTVGETGFVTFIYNHKLVTYTTVRAMDGNIWMQQNLGSKKVAEGFKDTESLGDLFQWGRWDDSHQLVTDIPNTNNSILPVNNPDGLKKVGRNPFYYYVTSPWWINGTSTDTWTASTPAEATATNGCDPCRAIGAGWHVPTLDEMKNVFSKEEITDPSSAMLSNLKLTNDGYMDATMGILGMTRKRTAVYWTSTPAEAEGRAFGMELSGKEGTTYRGTGASVRCIFKTK